MADGGVIRRGTVVWVKAPDESGGNQKCRPIVVLSTAADIAADPSAIVGVCCTTDPHDPRDPKFVYLGSRNEMTNAANLPAATWVNTEWHHTFAVEEVDTIGDPVRKRERTLIVQKTTALYAKLMADRTD